MSQRFLFVTGIGFILGVSGIAATRALTNFAQAAEQNQSHHASPPQVSTGRSVSGFGGSARTNTIRSATTKHGANVAGPHVAATMVHPAEPVLKTAALANSSKVQQQLAAQGQTQHWHHHHHHDWLWGQYGYLPTNASSVVVGVPTGNTLTVTNNAGFGAGFGLGYGTVVLQSRAQRAAQRHGLSIGGLPVVGSVANPGTVTVRLAGVASPMVGQPFATVSQQHLAALSMGKPVRVFQTGVDPTGAIVGQVFVVGTGTNLNERQLRDGMAYNTVGDGYTPMLAAAEEAALMARAGMWNGKPPIAPWLLTP
jgi:endonuclease YncB( thermonuclease family)